MVFFLYFLDAFENCMCCGKFRGAMNNYNGKRRKGKRREEDKQQERQISLSKSG